MCSPRALCRRAFWAAYAAVYDTLWDSNLTTVTGEALVDAVGQYGQGAPVLEVGAGTGLITRLLIEAGFDVKATEPMAPMRKRFQRRLPSTSVSPRPIEGLSRAERSGGTVVAVNVVHMTANPRRSVERLRSVAGIGGRVVLVSPIPGVSLRDVARANRQLGASLWDVSRFVAVHLMLGPLTAVAGTGLRSAGAAEALDTPAESRKDIAGVVRLLVLDGI